jgi:cellulose 1,4-beta-cellobiosidase
MRASRRGLVTAAVVTTLIAATATVATSIAHAAAPSRVAYMMTANWGTGFQASVTITPGEAVTSWSLSFDAADQQVVTFAVYADVTQVGRRVTLTNRPFNGSIGAGASLGLTLQFQNPTLTNAPPAGFVLNGQAAAYTPQGHIMTQDARPTVPEGGSTSVPVRLSAPPESDVRIWVGSGPVAAASPASLTFTPTNWNVPQTLALTSPEDADTTDQSAYVALQQGLGRPTYAALVLMPTQDDNDS